MKIHIYIFLFLLNNVTFAQDVPHLNAWSRFSITQPIAETWRVEVEVQHRRQSDFTEQTKNVFDENLMSSMRVWVNYQHKNAINFSISPFAYYLHNSIIVNEADKQKQQNKEIRFSFAIDLKYELVKKLWFINRTCFEYRDFQNTSKDFMRMRDRLGLRYEFTEKWNFTFFNELFLNLNGVKPVNSFDQNRMVFLLNYKPSSHIRIETGYIFITRLPRETVDFLHENNFLLHIYYTLPHKHQRIQPEAQYHS